MEIAGIRIRHPAFALSTCCGIALIVVAFLMQLVGFAGSGWWPGMTLVYGFVMAAFGAICLGAVHAIRLITKWQQQQERSVPST